MKLLIVTPTMAGGGAERVASIWANGLAERHQMYVLNFYPVNKEYELSEKVVHNYLYESENRYRGEGGFQKIARLRAYLHKLNPDVVIPLVTYVGILVHISSIGGKIRVIETIRNNPFVSPGGKLMRFLRNRSVAVSKGCIFQNQDQMRYFPQKVQKKALILANPVGEAFLCANHWEKNQKVILTVGRLESQKNHVMLIDAFEVFYKKHKDWRLEIYGDGTEKEHLQRRIQKAGLQHCIEIFERTEEIILKYESATIFVLSSDYEGMPNALMEAMAVGAPCISTDCPTGPGDLIHSGRNGFLVKTGNAGELAAKMEILAEHRDMRELFSQKAKETMAGYREPVILSQLESYIGKIADL